MPKTGFRNQSGRNTMVKGFMGKILWVDFSSGRLTDERYRALGRKIIPDCRCEK
jgi:hypothetical protein